MEQPLDDHTDAIGECEKQNTSNASLSSKELRMIWLAALQMSVWTKILHSNLGTREEDARADFK